MADTDRVIAAAKAIKETSIDVETAIIEGILWGRSNPEIKINPNIKKTDEIKRIQELADRGMLQKDIAECLGIHPRTVRKYAGRKFPKGRK